MLSFMKFDAALNTPDLRTVSALAEQIEALGFDGLWTTETAHNPFLPLTHAISSTTRLEVGTAIAVAFPRSPMVVAQIAWDLAAQSDGRFILGLGTQVRPHIVRRFSTVWDHPGPRLRDYIMSLRAIWDCWQNHRPLKYKGDYYEFTLMTPFFAPEPLHLGTPEGRIKKPDIPIYIAGVGPHLCKLAGELCQGFHVHAFHTPRYLREVILPAIAQGTASVGRTRADVQMTCGIFVVTGATDAEIAANANTIKAQIAFYASTPSYEAVMQLHGWEAPTAKLNEMSKRNRWGEMADLITDEMLHEFAVVAPYDQLAKRVRERYDGLLDRVAYYFPFESNLSEAQMALWRDAVAVLSDTKHA
ncbi:MAG: TIGR03617 family F420-dependent LLM class oxidoreductase [Aggregatilineales bacterium]